MEQPKLRIFSICQDATFKQTVLDPLGKYVAVFPEFQQVMKKRERKLMDFDRVRAAAKKEEGGPRNPKVCP
jgi:BAR domain